MVYRPSLLVATVRDLSMRASLAASTLTPTMTAPLESLTTPEIVLWATVSDGITRTARPTKIRETNVVVVIPFSP